MADRKSKLRRLCQVAATLALLLLLLLATLPLWFPWILSPLARTAGIQVGGYDRNGYGRLRLHDLHFAHEGTTITVRRAEIPQPGAWVWHRYAGNRPTNFVAITGWTVDVQNADAPKRSGSPRKTNSTSVVLEQVTKYVARLRPWIPHATLTDGRLTIQQQSFLFEAANWSAGRLSIRAYSDSLAQTFSVDLSLPDRPPFGLRVHAAPLGIDWESVITQSNRSWWVESELQWQTNRASLVAEFAAQGWPPARLALHAPSLQLPATMLKLQGYHDPTGAVHLTWTEGTFVASAMAGSFPGSATNLPPVRIDLAAQGNLDSVTLQRLQIDTPAAQANLTQPITFDRSGKLLSNGAQLSLAADLSAWTAWNMSGGISGQLMVRPGDKTVPRLAVDLQATNFHYHHIALQEGRISGTLTWPLIEALDMQGTLSNGARVQVAGNANLQTKQVHNVTWTYDGSPPQELLPAGITAQSLQARGQVDGSLLAFQHSGQVDVRHFVTPRTQPMSIQFGWKGTNLTLTESRWLAQAGEAQLAAEFSAQFSTGAVTQLSASVSTLTLAQGAETIYALQQPCAFTFQRGTGTNASWTAILRALTWEGPKRAIHAAGQTTWPASGEITLGLRQFQPAVFSNFVYLPNLDLTVNELDLNGGWDRSPLLLKTRVLGTVTWPGEGVFNGAVALVCSSTNLVVEQMSVEAASGPLLSLEGTLPILLTPAGSNFIQVLPDGEISFQGYSATNRVFWDRLSEVTKVQLAEPLLRLDIHGTPQQPEGTIQLSARRVNWTEGPEKLTLPPTENLDMEVRLQPMALVLEKLHLEVSGQPVMAQARVPLADRFWTQLGKQKALPDWRAASGELQIPDAEVAPFARYLPKILAPQGRLALQLHVAPGYAFQGSLRLTNAATRPLSGLGSIRDVEASVLFEQQSATIKEFSGNVGGQPVTLAGTVDWTGATLPDFRLHLTGAAVPLVRQAGSLIRSDLDVTFTHTNDQPVVISGHVKLTNSFFLQDIAALIPHGVTQPSQRPPYFSVEQEPFSAWQLNLRIQGDRFLKVRSPLFRGEVSTKLELKGTLQEPVALGQVNLYQSVIQFPFGNLAVDQGIIDLTSENPHDPQLLILASGRVFGYTIKLEVTGTATGPILAFSSTPPLSSEEVVLMLTAGELPKRETGVSSTQKAGRLALYLGRDLVTKLAGSDAAERLSISSGENISEQGDPTYYLEYKLNKDWSVIGEYDRFNELNAGLKWHIYSK